MVNWGPFYEKNLKSHNAKKTEGGTLWSRPGIVCYAETFSSLGQRVQFDVFSKFCRTSGVELFRSLQVYRKIFLKTLTKCHNYSRLFSQRSADFQKKQSI